MKISDGKGGEMEVFTQEELDSTVESKTKEASEKAAEEAVNKYKEENPDKTQELTDAQAKLEEAEKKLKEAEEEDDDSDNDKDSAQVKRLRKERDDAKKDLNEFKEGVDKKFEDLGNKVGGLVSNAKDEIVASLANGDEELKKKILDEYDGFKNVPETREDIQAQMLKAYNIVSETRARPDVFDSITPGGGGKGNSNYHRSGDEEGYKDNENKTAMRNVFGISDDDIKKHGGKVSNKL